MPLQIIDYSRIPVQEPDYSGIKSIIPGALEGFQTGTKMKQTKEKHEHEKKAAELVNAIKEKYGMDQAEAELALTKAQTEHQKYLAAGGGSSGGIGKESAFVRDLKNVLGDDTEAFNDAVLQYYGIQRKPKTVNGEAQYPGLPSDVPPDVVGKDISSLPAGSQNSIRKEQSEDLRRAEAMKRGLQTAEKLKKINDDNPHLWKSFSVLLEDPDKSSSIFKDILRPRITNEKDKTEIDKFHKLLSDLVLNQGQIYKTGNRITDAYLRVIMQGKPSLRNTSEANSYLLNTLTEEMSHGPAWADALRWGSKNNKEIISNPEAFKQYKSQPQPPGNAEAARALSNAGVKKEIEQQFDQEEVQAQQPSAQQYTQENLEYTAKQNNMTVQQVKEALGIR